MPLPFNVLLAGSFAENDVESRWVDCPLPTTADIDLSIETTWQAAETEAAGHGRHIYPGPMARLLGWGVEGRRLALTCGPTDYREFVGTNLRNPDLAARLGRANLANPLGVNVAVVTADDRLVLQRRSEHVFENPGMLHVCGGNVEPSDVAGPDAPGPLETARRELTEEFGVPPDCIAEVVCLGLVESAWTLKYELLVEAGVAWDAKTLLGATNAEYTELVVLDLDPGSLTTFIDNEARAIAPGGLACLLALGRRRFGEEWHEPTRRRIEPAFAETPA